MWMKIVGCIVLVIFLNCDTICGNVTPHMVSHHGVEPRDNIKISKNITIHRKGFGRFLGLLKLLKEFRHRRHIYNPYVISRLWRASFEFELNPHPMFDPEIPSNIYFPTEFGINSGGGGVASNGKPGNSGLGSNSIDSIFHFGNNEQQSSVTIGGSNNINKGERDELPIGHNQVIIKDAVDTVTVNDTETAVTEKSERVLRHAIQPRTDDESDVEETTVSSSTFNIDESETDDTTLAIPETTTSSTETFFPQTTSVMESSLPQTTVSEDMTTSQTTASTGSTEAVTTISPASSSTVWNNEQTSPMPQIPTEWLGYYDYGIHKPEFIQSVEFTTNYPQLVSEDIRYVKYETPFKPSRPDYTADTYAYSKNFFVPFKYFKR